MYTLSFKEVNSRDKANSIGRFDTLKFYLRLHFYLKKNGSFRPAFYHFSCPTHYIHISFRLNSNKSCPFSEHFEHTNKVLPIVAKTDIYGERDRGKY